MNLNANREHLLRCLREIPELAEEAFLTWGTQPISDDGPGRRKVPSSRVLADLDRLVAMAGIHGPQSTLWQWTVDIAAEMDEQGIGAPLPADTVRDVCAWLIQRLDWIEFNPWHVEGINDQIGSLHGALRAICKVRPEYVPRCRHCADVVVFCHGDGSRATWEDFAYGRCSGCGATYAKGPAMDALGQLQDFTIAELADRVKVPAPTLHKWAQRGIIQPVGKGPTGNLFRIHDVMGAKLKMGRAA